MASSPKKLPPAFEAPTRTETAAVPAGDFTKTVESLTAPAADIQENLRRVVEKGVAETRSAYAKAKVAAEEATGALEGSFSAAKTGLVAINAKALDALRANAEANFDFVKSVVAVKSVSEFVALQSDFASKQMAALTNQAKEIGALAQKVANDSVEPIKGQMAKTLKIAV